MEVGLKILDSNLNVIANLYTWFRDLQFSEFLDGVWSWRFTVDTQPNMISLLSPSNVVDIVDRDNNDKTLWRWFIRPFTVWCNFSTILLSDIKYRLDFSILETTGTFTNISDMLALLSTKWFNTVLNLPDKTFDWIEYRIGMKWYNVLEEIRKDTEYDWDFDWSTITFWRVWEDRTDLKFSSEAVPWNCKQSWWELFIENIESTFVEEYNKVIAYNPDVWLAISGTGSIEVSVDSNATTLADLQIVADEKLKLWTGRRVVTFDIPNVGDVNINVWDSIFTQASCNSDIIQLQDYVRVLKKEVVLNNCDLITRIFVSEWKVSLFDRNNIDISVDSRISNLETK